MIKVRLVVKIGMKRGIFKMKVSLWKRNRREKTLFNQKIPQILDALIRTE